MSPSKLQDSDVTKGKINGPRPLPLRLNTNSHVIHKPPSKLPIIIYTHSPKVIHTQAGAFMAVVQRLTGLQHDDDGDEGAAGAIKEKEEHSDTTSVLVGDRRFMGGRVKQEPVSPMYKMSSEYLIDAPLFMPNSNEFFSASRPNPLFQTPDMAANSISPSFMDYVKAFPDYC